MSGILNAEVTVVLWDGDCRPSGSPETRFEMPGGLDLMYVSALALSTGFVYAFKTGCCCGGGTYGRTG